MSFSITSPTTSRPYLAFIRFCLLQLRTLALLLAPQNRIILGQLEIYNLYYTELTEHLSLVNSGTHRPST